MKYLSKTILAGLAIGVLSCALLSQEAQAVMIVGDISFQGTVGLDNSDLGLATAVTDWHGVGGFGRPKVAAGTDGDFIGLLGSKATFAAPWSFNSGSLPGFWTVGGFTFDLTASAVDTQNSTYLKVSGTGFVSGNGFDPTPGSWSFEARDRGNPLFQFRGATATDVPDGGATVALLGLALAGVAVVRRKLKAA